MFTYRWTIRTIYPNIKYFIYDIIRGISNIVRWTPIIWSDRDFDWAYMARIMEYKMRRMSKCFTHEICTNDKKKSKELLICAELLKRLIEDDNFKMNPDYMDQFSKIFNKKFLTWWN